MSATVFLDRDNKITLKLLQDGAPITEDLVTKAVLWVPGTAFSSGLPQVVDSDGPNITLTDGATKVTLELGSLDVKQGAHSCYLTVYDAAHPNGIAWDRISLRVRNWPAEV